MNILLNYNDCAWSYDFSPECESFASQLLNKLLNLTSPLELSFVYNDSIEVGCR